MQQVTIGTRYQVVIPQSVRSKIKGLLPGTKVVVHPIDAETIAIRRAKTGWVERTYGMMKQAWRKNPLIQLEKIRREWGT